MKIFDLFQRRKNGASEVPAKGTIHFLRPHGGGGGQAQVDACGRGRGEAPCGRPHRKLKLESTDVILSSSHEKKLVYSFYQNFVFGRNKMWTFFGDIN